MKQIDIIVPFFNAANTIRATLQSLQTQQIGDGDRIKIILVDDGSQDGGIDEIRDLLTADVQVYTHASNRGRAAARNTGVAAALGDCLLFVDADCLPCDQRLVARHLDTLKEGCDISIGVISCPGASFWERYQNEVTQRRITSNSPVHLALTAANFAIRRDLFEQSGGFDERYKGYGFEDKDIAVRLCKTTRKFCLNPAAVVWHRHDLTVESLVARMADAGEYTAGIFSADHPEDYARLPYRFFDFRFHPIWGRILLIGYPFAFPLLNRAFAWACERRLIPFRLQALLFKLLVGLAFFSGTRRAWLRVRHG
jgi:glycosyltransferase involved in cell wall biosynthesis